MARSLRDSGWEVRILAAQSATSSTSPNGRYPELVTYLPSLDMPFVFRIVTLLSAYRWLIRHAHHDDIILINDDALWLIPLLHRQQFKNIHLDIRTLPVSIKGFKRHLDWWLFWRIPIRRFALRASSFSFITKRLRDEIERSFSISFPEHCIWQSGVNAEFFRAGVRTSTSNDKFRIFYHGSISLERGLDLVIRALAIQDLPFPLEFVVIGDGPGRTQLETLVRDLGVEHLVVFPGYVAYENVPSEVASADICICPLPDRLEWNVSSPLKVLEYAAARKPLILTPIPAHKDVFDKCSFVTWTEGYEPRHFLEAILTASSKHQSGPWSSENAEFDELVGEFEWRRLADILNKHLSRAYAADENAPGA